MQNDGNLCIYDSSNKFVWQTATSKDVVGKCYPDNKPNDPRFDVWYAKTTRVNDCVKKLCSYGCVETTCKVSYGQGCIVKYEDYVALNEEATR